MEREKIYKLVDKVLDIAEKGKGENGFPYIDMQLSNYGKNVEILVKDSGFQADTPYDGIYDFDIIGEISLRKYNTCLGHLEELKERAEGFFK